VTVLPTFHTKPLKARGAVILFHEGKLLLMRQNNKPFWVLPGGTLEENESLAQCAARELKEEAGLGVAVGPLLTLSEFSDARRHVIDAAFYATYQAGPTEWAAPFPENIDAISWVTETEFNQLELKPQRIAIYIATHWQDLTNASGASELPGAVYLELDNA
jgi:8-oxo-dGTP diphosphatase